MRHQRPDLLIPVRDRRQHRRILTLKNAGIAFGVLVLAFVVLTIYDGRLIPSGDDYGRLMKAQVPHHDEPIQPKYDVVAESASSVDDQTAADPMLTSAAAREQYLGVTATTASAATVTSVPAPVASSPRTADANVTIVGGTDGVTIVRDTDTHTPKLAGGIFRP